MKRAQGDLIQNKQTEDPTIEILKIVDLPDHLERTNQARKLNNQMAYAAISTWILSFRKIAESLGCFFLNSFDRFINQDTGH